MAIQLNEWLSIDKVSGWGNDRVTLTAISNEGLEERISNIKFECLTTNAVLNVKQEINPSNLVNNYFWVKLEEDGEISGIKSSTIQYSYDRESWTSFPSNGNITVPANTYVWFRNTSDILNYGTTINDACTSFTFSKRGSIGGDLSSMGGMEGDSSSTMTGNFTDLFYMNENLTDASKLILPWETLKEYCFSYMFWGCTSLTTAPELPATTLAQYCYWGMFRGCTSLTIAPELPATTLAQSCYSTMFEKCTSLTTAPELPATTLRLGCYGSMFLGCTSLVNPPVLPATELEDSCYGWMFRGCTSLTTAPELPATELAEDCYLQMFQDCTNLNYVKMLATDFKYVSDCLTLWLQGVSPTGTFVKNASVQTSEFKRGDSGIPNGWTVINATE